MPNPYAQFQRPGLTSTGKASGGGVRSSGLIVPANAPPLWQDTLHWYDFTDPAVLFSDVGGTIPVLPTEEIDYITNKGAKGIEPAVEGTQNPIHTPNVVNGLSVGDNSTGGLGFPIQWQGPEGIDVSVTGFSMLIAMRVTDTSNQSFMSWGIGGNFIGIDINSTLWRFNWSGNNVSIGFASVTMNQWVLLIARMDTAGNYSVNIPGLGSVTGTLTPMAFPDGSNMGLHGLRGDMGDNIFWCKNFTPQDELDVIAWAEAKYGQAFPFI